MYLIPLVIVVFLVPELPVLTKILDKTDNFIDLIRILLSLYSFSICSSAENSLFIGLKAILFILI